MNQCLPGVGWTPCYQPGMWGNKKIGVANQISELVCATPATPTPSPLIGKLKKKNTHRDAYRKYVNMQADKSGGQIDKQTHTHRCLTATNVP